MQNKTFIPPEKLSSKSFTLIELIVVIIIVGILAAVGISQYSETVEKSRLAEAKIRIGVMKKLAYEYFLTNGSFSGIADGDVGAGGSCTSNSYYYYVMGSDMWNWVNLHAFRCTSGGKTPNATRGYNYWFHYRPAPGYDEDAWHCSYSDDGSSCFGLSPS